MSAKLEQVVRDYLAFLERGQGLSRKVVRRHGCYTTAFLASVRRQGLSHWPDLAPHHLDRFSRHYLPKFNRPYRATIISVVRRFLRYLRFRGLLERPLDVLLFSPRIYRHERLPRFFTPDELRRLLAAVDRSRARGRRDYAILLLLVSTGLRAGELLRLTLDDVDWRGRLLRVRPSKTRTGRTVPLPPAAFDSLADYVRRDRPVVAKIRSLFLTLGPAGAEDPAPRGLSYTTLNRVANQYVARAGLRRRSAPLHGLRHSFAQHLLDQGAGFPALQALLGHGSLQSTHFYTRVHFAQLREVADNYAEAL